MRTSLHAPAPQGRAYVILIACYPGDKALGYFDASLLGSYWQLAHNYVLMDNFFSSTLGGSVDNHMFLVAGQTLPPRKLASHGSASSGVAWGSSRIARASPRPSRSPSSPSNSVR